MHLQILGSGSGGNSALVRAGETHLLLDAGLPIDVELERLERARVALSRIDHIALSHGHLDHARAAGGLARRTWARLACSEHLMSRPSLRHARRFTALPLTRTLELSGGNGRDPVALLAVPIPHDAHPTVAFRVEHAGRALVLITDMGQPDWVAARALRGAHLLMLEFNHDREMLANGPYAFSLKRRIAGPRGHLSNQQAARMLELLAGPELHTLVLAHLSQTNNTPDLARETAEHVLARLGLCSVRVLIAEQDAVGPNLEV